MSGVNLHGHVGKRVAINGVVRQQQSTTTRSASAPATDEPARSTGGTPSVETTATLQMKRIEVSAINRVAGDCEK